MSVRKNGRVYPPEYVSAETLAYRLDCSISTIERYVRDGLLPPARRIGALVRWRFAEVEAAIESGAFDGRRERPSPSLVGQNGVVASEADPFLIGVDRVETG